MNKPLILSNEEILARLPEIPGWSYLNQKLTKEFKFKTFMDVIKFINELAPFCEEINHHPDMHIYYNKIVFELQCLDVGGKVTDKDFAVAKEIEKNHQK